MDQSLRTLIEQAEFKESFRGYDRAQVDDTLEELATRAGKLEAEAAEATRRLEDAETRIRAELQAGVGAGAPATTAAKTGPPAPNEQQAAEEVRLTLVMAQRTADAAIAEARVKAEELLDAARTEAMRTTADARSESTKERQEGRKRLATEIKQLEDVRTVLQGDIKTMELHVKSEREQLSTAIDRLRALLEDPEAFRTKAPPTPTPVTIPDPPDDAESQPASVESDGQAAAQGATSAAAADGAGDTHVDHAEPGVAGATSPAGAAQPAANGEAKAEAPSVDASHEEDAFLSELRKAMSDDEPRTPAVGPAAGQAAESSALSSGQGASAVDHDKPRFGRRR